MKIDKLTPGIVVYSISRTQMGNTRIKTVSIYPIRIIAVDPDHHTVRAEWNGNEARNYGSRTWSRWRLKRPVLIKNSLGQARIARRGELAAKMEMEQV